MKLLRLNSAMLLLTPLARSEAASQPTNLLPGLLEAVDHVYYINMDGNEERRKGMENSLESAGVTRGRYTRVAAVDGSHARVARMPDFGSLRYTFEGELGTFHTVLSWDLVELTPYARNRFSARMMGCTLSHAKAARAAYSAGHKTVLILEDDVRLDENHLMGVAALRDGGPSSRFRELFSNLPPDWRILQVGYTCSLRGKMRTMRQAYDDGYAARARSVCSPEVLDGTFAYLLSRRGMLALLRRFWPGGRTLKAGAAVFEEEEDGLGALAPGVTDVRSAPNGVADYSLYSMPHVYVMTMPGLQPPNGFSSTVGSGDDVVTSARAMLAELFPFGKTQTRAENNDNNARNLARSPFSSDLLAMQQPVAVMALSSTASGQSGCSDFFHWESQNGLTGSPDFNTSVLIGVAEPICRYRRVVSEAGELEAEFCGWAVGAAWQYAVNCGLATAKRRSSASGRSARSTACLAYFSGYWLQVYHMELDDDPTGRKAHDDSAATCEAVAFAAADAVIAATAAVSLPQSAQNELEFVAGAVVASFRPALRLLAKQRVGRVEL